MKFLISLLALSLVIQSYGQEQDVEFKASNFKEDKAGLKAAKFELDAGTHFFEEGQLAVFAIKNPEKSFLKALQHFQKAYDFNPNSAELNFKMGVCYMHSVYKQKSVDYLKKAYKLNPLTDPFLDYYMGLVYHLEENYPNAIKFYTRFQEKYKKADDFAKFVKKRKKECEYAQDISARPRRVWIDNIEELNTPYNDFAPSITMDGEELVFTSNRPNAHQPNELDVYDNEIYTCTFENGRWTKPQIAKGGINSEVDELSNCFSYNGTKMLISKRNENGDYDIYESFLKGDSWSDPVGISKNINLKSDDKYASYSEGDVYIYYTKATATGSNGYDVYISGVMNRVERKYGSPTKVMNSSSPFNEGPIYLHPDGKTMYFASEGHNSMGGYDIFKCTYSSGEWSKPVNMGYPINTPYDDLFFSSSANGKYAYIASNRAGGKGGNDLYRVTFWGEEKNTRFKC